MKLGALFGAVAVAAIVVWMLTTEGAWRVLDLVGNAGWLGLIAVVLFHPLQLLCSGAGWRALAEPGPARPSLGVYTALRWIRESVSQLLPVTQIGGELVGIRLLHRQGVRLNFAIASSLGDLTVEVITLLAFTLIGLGLLLATIGDHPIARTALVILAVAGVAAAAFVAAQGAGLGGLIEFAMQRLGRAFGWKSLEEEVGVHAALIAIYSVRVRLAWAGFFHLVSWLLGGLEVCLVMHVLGHDVGITTGLVIESLGQTFRALGFAVPGALGIQEGAYAVMTSLYGFSPELGVAVSLVKRVREIALGLPGLAAWRWLEAKEPIAT